MTSSYLAASEDTEGIIQQRTSSNLVKNNNNNSSHVTITTENIHNNNILTAQEQELQEEQQRCMWWIYRIPTVLFITFMIGVTVGTTSAIIPTLQGDVFGNNSFTIVGGFGGGKGILALAYTPLVGSLSDEKSRFYVLMATMCLSMIPWAIMTVFDNFWVYTVANMMFGLYNVSFTLLVVIIVARVPQINKSRTLALSTNVAVFLFGIGGSSFLGPEFSGKMAFGISLLCQFLSTLAAFLFLRKTTNIPNKYFHLAEIGSSSSGSAFGATDATTKKYRQDEQEQEQDHEEENNNNNTSSQQQQQQTETESSSLLPSENTNNKDNSSTTKKDETEIVNNLVAKNHKHYSLWFHLNRAYKLFLANRNIRVLFLVSFFNYLTSDMLDQMLFLYLDEALGFSDNETTYTIAVMSVASVLFVIFVAATRNVISDVWVLRMSLMSSFVMTCLYGVVKNKLFVIMLPAVNVIGMAALPAVSSLTVDSVSASEIGVGQGCVQSARVLAGVICPFMYGELFEMSWHLSSWQGWPFFVAAFCILISIATTSMLRL